MLNCPDSISSSFISPQVFCFSSTGQNVAASLLGARAYASNVYSTTNYGIQNGNDMIADPYVRIAQLLARASVKRIRISFTLAVSVY